MDSASGPNSEMVAALDLASKEVVDDVTGYEQELAKKMYNQGGVIVLDLASAI